MSYEDFKKETIEAGDVVRQARKMRIIDETFADGFLAGMWEAREIFMRLDDQEKATND